MIKNIIHGIKSRNSPGCKMYTPIKSKVQLEILFLNVFFDIKYVVKSTDKVKYNKSIIFLKGIAHIRSTIKTLL